jgi:hypothetical protein
MIRCFRADFDEQRLGSRPIRAIDTSPVRGLLVAFAVSCSSTTPNSGPSSSGVAGPGGTSGTSGASAGTTTGAATGGSNSGAAAGGSGSGAAASGSSSGAAASGTGSGAAASGSGSSAADGGSSSGAADAGSSGAAPDAGVNMVPPGYKGTPFKTLTIPGTISAADYDRGGASVAFCRSGVSCTVGIVTGDWAPANTPPYRPPVPATAKICSGAACDDNVGLCRMNPAKPDHTITGQPVMPVDTYVCYSTAGEWLKYTVEVAAAGAYSVGGFMAVPTGGGVNLSFGGAITTGNVALPLSPTTTCACSENYHSWAQRDNLATVTFPAAGTYVMTMTLVGRFNADTFTFTKQ